MEPEVRSAKALRRTRSGGWMLLAPPTLAIEVAVPASQTPPTAQSVEYFEAKVRPVLAANCYDCHTDERMGGLRLDSREGLLKGGESGPAIVPGDPDKSLMIAAVRQTGALKMPKGGVLTADDVSALVEWVRAGAVWSAAPARSASNAAPA